MRELGPTFRRRREQLGIPQAELSRRLGISRSRLCHYEKGDRNVPWRLICELSKLLNIQLETLAK